MYTQDMINRVPLKTYKIIPTGTNLIGTVIAVPVQTLDGAWYVELYINCGLSVSASSLSMTFPGLTFFGSDSIACHHNAAGAMIYIEPNTGASTASCVFGTSVTGFWGTGKVRLTRKPDFVE